ncbi:F0F1 ATP synthase subunit delta [Campylobacter hepaticus]|uniref:ATP synthase subunit delta n=1 Tax=Campylobacter hepaticus TaxID=1813019 RepID=A0A6A7JS80_9BACT|nr:F0F1 ATP synthase subunit delta [Campylobacter hepaticus]AXP09157.1 F0F1 ATP synthase subunit delta [Campylobacter hepaticus]MCZ0771652.1 F0F1 ATP synthase subunit delta [Campylobacter hepaticus]MCZ0773120.1 F0F1 ATP synthase subunit delta [Campylobacter hepaticus]MCZ0775800.1 F0F1 ATP synthase subunit delta [Campylobacter hepaticus]MDX2323421.1 F0F1 ATP synthase subunit delta [Campylobacter hepaticus]
MEKLIARRYAKAIISRSDIDEFYHNLCIINSVFALTQFKNIIESNQINKIKKLELLISFFEVKNSNFENFLKLLVYNSRLEYIPYIVKELEREKAIKENMFMGVIYSRENINEENLKDLEIKLSKKFNTNIKLINKITQNDGIKIELEELGYELSFSMKALQNKLNEYILKII